MMERYSLFQMWEPYRKSLINGHLFYVEQARIRLLSQFDDIEGEADKAAESWLDANKHRFNPDYHDPGDFYESARDEGIEFYRLLSEMRDRTRLSVVAGIYHEWDKHLRKWLTDEIRHWHVGEAVPGKVWVVDFGKLVGLMESLGWKVRGQAYFPKLDACRLVVNVYKHGKGGSFNELKEKYPEYLPHPLGKTNQAFSGLGYLDYTHLEVSEDQIQDFSDAIVAFWNDVPKDIFDREDFEVPGWFARAVSDDQQAAIHQQQGGPNP
jgi:hypothetical protein